MHTFKSTLLAVLSYVALIGATPLGNGASPPTYVLLTTASARGGSDLIENTSPAQTTLSILSFRPQAARCTAQRA
jgi:hypothetical protein